MLLNIPFDMKEVCCWTGGAQPQKKQQHAHHSFPETVVTPLCCLCTTVRTTHERNAFDSSGGLNIYLLETRQPLGLASGPCHGVHFSAGRVLFHGQLQAGLSKATTQP